MSCAVVRAMGVRDTIQTRIMYANESKFLALQFKKVCLSGYRIVHKYGEYSGSILLESRRKASKQHNINERSDDHQDITSIQEGLD